MGEALRGTKLGAVSYENDRGVQFAPRLDTAYRCAAGHLTEVPFSIEADVPALWECRTCGDSALRVDAEQPEPIAGRKLRTPWDMLVERRTVGDLEDLLQERLTLLRGAGGAGQVLHADYHQAQGSKPRGRSAPAQTRKSA